MPQKIPIISRDYLKDVPLPQYVGGRYTVISHEAIISFLEQEIANKGLYIENREFRASRAGRVATGCYHVKYSDDKEIGLMVGFVNSYDKTVRFSCTVGGFNKIYGNNYIDSGDQTWLRKHTGTADKEAEEHISDQLNNAAAHYDKIVRHRALFKRIPIHPQLKASILGYLFFEKELLTADQANALVKNMKSKTYASYKGTSLWGLYNHISIVLKSTHPLEWLKNQSAVHNILLNTFALNIAEKENNDNEILPGQLNVFDQLVESPITVSNGTDKTTVTEEEVAALYEDKDEVPLTEQHVTEETVEEIVQEVTDTFPETMAKLDDEEELKIPDESGFDNSPTSFTIDDL